MQNIENATPASVTLVSVQSVECYGEGYYKFKGGLAVIVRTIHEASAMGLTCKWLTEQGLSAGYYPRHAEVFASEAEAIASLPEWDNEVEARLG
jgi:hypothetical protein